MVAQIISSGINATNWDKVNHNGLFDDKFSTDQPNGISNLIDGIQFLQKSMSDGNDDVLRTFLQCYGISWLDGMDLFDNLSSTYCLVKLSLLEELNPWMRSILRAN